MFPPGPMKVLNIKLKGTGGEKSFPVVGDFYIIVYKKICKFLLSMDYRAGKIHQEND